MDTLLQSWGSGMEIWLLSMYQDPTNPRNILVTKKIDEFREKVDLKHQFLYEWQVIKYRDMPNYYFPFKDTSSFVIVDKEELDQLLQ
jgi:hypothetical protein